LTIIGFGNYNSWEVHLAQIQRPNASHATLEVGGVPAPGAVIFANGTEQTNPPAAQTVGGFFHVRANQSLE
jgi:hypothetical protein